MQPYSLDFRQKIIEVYELEKLSIRKLAKRFIDGIFDAMLSVSQQDIRNWFTHCCYCTS